MPILVADRVQETTNTTGTSTLTLGGALAGYQSFAAAFPSGGQVYYAIVNGVQWEVGIGTYTVAGTSLSRTTILASSNAGLAISLVGSSNVYCDFPAALAATLTNTTGSGAMVMAVGPTLVTPELGAATSSTLTTDGYNIVGRAADAAAAHNASFALKSSRGTLGAPLVTQNGDTIGNIDAFGYTGTAYGYASSIDFQAAGAWSGTSTPTQINFNTTAVGATAPTQTLTINSTLVSSLVAFHTTGVDANYYAFSAASYNNAVNGTGIQLIGARGTVGAPAATAASDILGNIDFYGYGTALVEGAAIDAVAGSLWSGTNAETYLSFYTTPNASVTAIERFRILSNGAVSFMAGGGQALPATVPSSAAPTNSSLITSAGAITSMQVDTAGGYNFIGLGYSTANTANASIGLKSQTRGAATIISNGDTFGNIDAFGWLGAAWGYSASIDFVASAAWTSGTSYPSSITFNTTAAAANAPVTVGTLNNTGFTLLSGILASGTFANTFTDGVVVDYTTGNGRISVGAADTITLYNGGLANTSMMSVATTGVTIPASGILAVGTFSSAYTDGTVIDYATGNGRISVGAADTLSIYNGGIANTLMLKVGSTGVTAPAAITAAGQIYGAQVATTISTAGAGVLTAAAMVGGIISRTGPTAGYTDTTDTAANIVAAIPNAQVGTAFKFRILNTVAFAATAPTAGAGVTIAGAPYVTTMVASSYRDFVGVITNVGTPAVTLYGIGSGTL